jgi:hypothetical protein
MSRAPMRLLPALILASAALIVSGCATTSYKAQLPTLVESQCVSDLRDVKQIPLRYAPSDPKAVPKPLEFASLAQCLRLGDAGTTPVAMYRFDGVAPPAQLEVSVNLSTGGTFAAAVDVLDSEYRSLRRHGFADFVRRGSVYSLDVFLNPNEAQPAYLLVSHDRAQAGKSDVAIGSTAAPMVIPAGPVMFVYNNGFETSAVRPFLEGGLLQVLAKPQGSAAFSKDAKKR